MLSKLWGQITRGHSEQERRDLRRQAAVERQQQVVQQQQRLDAAKQEMRQHATLVHLLLSDTRYAAYVTLMQNALAADVRALKEFKAVTKVTTPDGHPMYRPMGELEAALALGYLQGCIARSEQLLALPDTVVTLAAEGKATAENGAAAPAATS